MQTSYLFPGQGSQRVGMGRDLRAAYPDLLGPIFDTADEILGFELSRLCWEGPEDRLQRTDITQPAVFLASYAAYRVLAERLPPPAVVAGHSLGEYTALVAAGVLEWTDALALVRRRGTLMAEVNESTPGAMAAALGLPATEVERICAAVRAETAEVVEVANYNSADQTVVSGSVAGVAAFGAWVLALGRAEVQVKRIKVGAPFHSSMMAAVEAEFATDLARVRFADPVLPIIANVTAQPVRTGEQSRAVLRSQLTGSVRWSDTLTAVLGYGVDTFVEVGPGRVLAGLCKRAYPEIACCSAGDARRIEAIAAAVDSEVDAELRAS
ncbi:ACP S-malonyltransferase [Nocardia goodfellowii]|uniref:Malonyl CoA-acyl carrier protein transacylase n=1 Tax=Nocardia goodfellowii TaxID=882446 RepID=A0ABS4QE90_9NOCA|nr:ACP S-malonyltransferase [Nocardia goodfellowii]MBP2189883.1 [acyl-carrier-protein] S-malonyltransferase [Nocardia goodfellowii]